MKWIISREYSFCLLLYNENQESLTKPARFFFQFQMKQTLLERLQPALQMATGHCTSPSLPWREMCVRSLISGMAGSYPQAAG